MCISSQTTSESACGLERNESVDWVMDRDVHLSRINILKGVAAFPWVRTVSSNYYQLVCGHEVS